MKRLTAVFKSSNIYTQTHTYSTRSIAISMFFLLIGCTLSR